MAAQAVRLPKAFRFEGSEGHRAPREGDAVILEPVKATRPTPEEMAAFWAKSTAWTPRRLPDPRPSRPAGD